MKIKIVASDSMGVRSLATIFECGGVKIAIDPGIALSPKRFGLPPHKKELEKFRILRNKLFEEVSDCEFIFISHYHHDHFVPFYKKDYVVSGFSFAEKIYTGKKVFLKSPYENMNYNQKQRGKKLIKEFKKREVSFEILEGEIGENYPIDFYSVLTHGGSKERGSVGVVGFVCGREKFLYCSDCQFMDENVCEMALQLKPDVLLSSGPPIYLENFREEDEKKSISIIKRVSPHVGNLILDHHLIRSKDYEKFLENLSLKNIFTSSSFMGLNDEPLERERKENYFKKR